MLKVVGGEGLAARNFGSKGAPALGHPNEVLEPMETNGTNYPNE